MKQIINGIFRIDENILVTKNLTPKKIFFSEEIIKINNSEYRIFNPQHSKLAAALIKGIKGININNNFTVLYLGAAHGYTCSFLSDIIDKGFIFAIDIAPDVFSRLLMVSKERKNMIPILADANHPETYFHRVLASDFIYQDIAQKNQVQIFIKNIKLFLKHKASAIAILCIKARAIDSVKDPEEIFKKVITELKNNNIKIIDKKTLELFQKDHCVFICQK